MEIKSRLYLLRRLWSFGVQHSLRPSMTLWWHQPSFGVVCWTSGSSAADRKRLEKLIKRASLVLGCPCDPVEVAGERRIISKLSSLMDNLPHPLHDIITALGSSFSRS